MNLSEEQEEVLAAIRAGESVFITGAAGTGKSEVLKAYIRSVDGDPTVGITATTGCAALLIGGRTVHSFLGIGLGRGNAAALAAKVFANPKRMVMLEDLRVLVIDEISMMDADLLTKVSKVLGLVRRRPHSPFGGVQVIFCGDLCQLRPVSGDYPFKSPEWKALAPRVFDLKFVFRVCEAGAAGDAAAAARFKELLGRARLGELNEEDLDILERTKGTVFPDHIRPARLHAHNYTVDAINAREFEALVGAGAVKRAYPVRAKNKKAKEWAARVGIGGGGGLELCIGAQVMVTWNVNQDDGIVNGTMGMVVRMTDREVFLRRTDGAMCSVGYIAIGIEDDPKVKVEVMPLRLAWAITAHKSQGATLDAAEMDLGHRIFEYGQAYTALSRVRSLAGLRVLDVCMESFRAHPDVLEFYGRA